MIDILPTYKITRDFSLLTHNSLVQFFNHNWKFNTVLNCNDSNSIGNIIINELNLIIETIASSKRI